LNARRKWHKSVHFRRRTSADRQSEERFANGTSAQREPVGQTGGDDTLVPNRAGRADQAQISASPRNTARRRNRCAVPANPGTNTAASPPQLGVSEAKARSGAQSNTGPRTKSAWNFYEAAHDSGTCTPKATLLAAPSPRAQPTAVNLVVQCFDRAPTHTDAKRGASSRTRVKDRR
jgi:hypothetical protein